MADIAKGSVDREGRLVVADARLAALQMAAGGTVGGEFAVPALASMARHARTLGILISRSVIVAEGDHDLELFVRARPDGDDTALAVSGWTVRPQRRPWLVIEDEAAPTPVSDAESFAWSVDASLVITKCGLPGGEAAIGQTLASAFRLIDGPDGSFCILAAVAMRSDFIGQRAVLRESPGTEWTLDGTIKRDADGAFVGYDGAARVASDMAVDEAPNSDSDSPILDEGFSTRLDSALRTPLARIAANADSIAAQADGPLRRDYADYAGDIGSAARHLLALVDDLADLQAVERPGFRIEPEDIDLADLARRAGGLLQVRAIDKSVRIDRPGTDEMLPARGDFRRVLQILVNLIGNAVRYSPEGGMVWIRTERDADTAVLIVADQGKGISPEDQTRIFDKFERVDPTEPGGSGLGLFIARRLAQAMGGDITVDSAPGQGARFVMTLPAA